MKKKSTKILISTMVATMAVTVSLPAINAYASEANSVTINNEVGSFGVDLNGLSSQEQMQFNDFIMSLRNNADFTNAYNQSIKENTNPMERGKFTGSAKIAGKALIAAIKKVGKKSWNKTVSYMPVTKAFAKKYLSYEVILKALNVVTHFEGKLEDGLAKQFRQMGMSAYWARTAAIIIVTVAL